MTRNFPNHAGWKRWVTHWPWAVLALLLALQWLCVRRDIAASGTYPQHTDQRHLVHPAQDILETGSLNPKRFNYPSAPVYLTAVGMSLGIFQEQKDPARKAALQVDQLGSLHKPFIKYPRVVNTARKLFGLMSLLILALTGWLGCRLYGRHLLWAAPLLLMMSHDFYFLSWGYLNVDVLAALGIALTLATLVTAESTTRVSDRIVIPAMCAGFAIACKYTMVVVLLPLLLSVWLFEGPFKIRRSLLAFAVTCTTFAILCPFSILDLPRFINDVGYEVWHYAVRGHAGQAGEPGAWQLWQYIRDFADQFTWVGMALASIGLLRGLWTRPRGTTVCLSFLVALMWLLSGQRVHFSRNITAALGLIAIWIVLGASWLYTLLPVVLARWGKLAAKPVALSWATRGLALLALVGMVWGRPLARVMNRARAASDTRIEFIAWAREHLDAKVLHIPEELAFDERRLPRRIEVKRFAIDAKGNKEVEKTAKRHGEYALVPEWSDRKRRSASRKLCGEQVLHFEGREVAKLITIDPELTLLKLGPCTKRGS